MTSHTANWLADKTVLVTGASGTIAGGLITEILRMRPRVLRVLDNHEHGLFELQCRLGHFENIRFLLGDIRDELRLCRAMEGVDVVFHTAALKHVTIGEYNPFEIVQTNLVGLQNVIQAALENDVGRVLFTSSDKAVNPTNAMGASKLMGERLVATANMMRGSARTRFAAVRFGNVLGSKGSVIGVFQDQIARGGPVTLTDRRMTRFVMGLNQAVRLVLHAAHLTVGGEVFVLKMPVLRIADLADVMIHRLAEWAGRRPSAIKVVEIGCRPGEKLYEELLMDAEVPSSYEDDDLLVYLGEGAQARENEERDYLREMRPAASGYHSGQLAPMTSERICGFLEEIGVLKAPAHTRERA